MAHKVFICHSSKDKQVADAACAALENLKISCWIAPRDILAGEEYGKAIVDALSSCQIVLVIFSAHANDSPQVRREVERSVSKDKIILPFRIEDVLPSDAMEFALGNTHWLDAITPPMERRLLELCDTISRLLHKRTVPETQHLRQPERPTQKEVREPSQKSVASGAVKPESISEKSAARSEPMEVARKGYAEPPGVDGKLFKTQEAPSEALVERSTSATQPSPDQAQLLSSFAETTASSNRTGLIRWVLRVLAALILVVIFLVRRHSPPVPASLASQAHGFRNLLCASVAAGDPNRIILVQVQSNGTAEPSYKINQDEFSKSSLEPKLAEIYATRQQKVMFVKGDPDLEFGLIAELFDFGHQAGVDNVCMITPRNEATTLPKIMPAN
jgi:biopolymer transport protein ExbD